MTTISSFFGLIFIRKKKNSPVLAKIFDIFKVFLKIFSTSTTKNNPRGKNFRVPFFLFSSLLSYVVPLLKYRMISRLTYPTKINIVKSSHTLTFSKFDYFSIKFDALFKGFQKVHTYQSWIQSFQCKNR